MSTRSVTIPYCYTARVVTSSGSVVSRNYVETMDVEIAELPASGPTLEWEDRGARVVVRTVDGAPHKEMPAQAGGSLAQDVLKSMSSHLRTVQLAFQTKQKGPPRPSTIEHTYKSDCQGDVRKDAAALAIIGGVLHRRIEEPVLIADEGKVHVLEDTSYAAAHNLFRLDELELAIERAAILGGIGREQVAVAPFALPDAGWLRRDQSLPAIASAARLVRERAEQVLAQLPVEIMMEYCDLRDALGRRERSDEEIRRATAALLSSLRPRSAAMDLAVAAHVLSVDGARREAILTPPVPVP